MRILTCTSLAVLLAATGQSTAGQVETKAAEVLTAARETLGGAGAFERVETLSVSGSHRRVMGQREFASEVTVEIAVPDKVRRVEEFGVAGGPRTERIAVLNGDTYWEDGTNRGGMVMRFGGPGGPGGPAGEPSEEARERFRRMQQRRLKGELARLQLALLLRADSSLTYAGVAEAPDGRADVLEVQVDGSPIRLFVDQETHAPLMLTYEAPAMRQFVRRGGGRPSPEEIQRLRSQPPPMATYEVRFDEYKDVDGLMVPHVIVTSMDGQVIEEWTIDRVQLNPAFKADRFEKKGS